MKDETAEIKTEKWRANKMGKKMWYLVNSNVKMTARLRPPYVHNNDSDTSCCKMRHFTKVLCGIAGIFTLRINYASSFTS